MVLGKLKSGEDFATLAATYTMMQTRWRPGMVPKGYLTSTGN